jgi:hypothetical protein
LGLAQFELDNPTSDLWDEDTAKRYNELASDLNEVTGGIKEYERYVEAVKKATIAEREFTQAKKDATIPLDIDSIKKKQNTNETETNTSAEKKNS